MRENWAVDVSVIIPTHNKQQELRRCLKALLAQQFAGFFEVLVCDDESRDGTAEMVQEWSQREPRLRYLCQPPDPHAPLVAMSDDDAIPEPDWLSRLCE